MSKKLKSKIVPAMASAWAGLAAIFAAISATAEEPDTVLSRSRQVEVGKSGPWGVLEYYKIPLTVPDSLIRLHKVPSQQIEWRIPARSVVELRQFLLEKGLLAEEIDAALEGATMMKDGEGSRFFPAPDALYDLDPDARARLYRILAKIPGNPFHARPVYLHTSNLSEWFEGSGVPKAAILDVSQLAYPTPTGRGFFFADLPFTLRNAMSTADERTILSGMLRRPGLIVRLRLAPDSPIDEMREYWSAGFRNLAVRPLLESAVVGIGSGFLDIAHLLPPTAREDLNQFPGPADGARGRYPDWFWTCYNFFLFETRDVYADSPERDSLILEEFERAAPPLQFGDMLLLGSGNRIVHGCVHLADDIVFTKNGADIFSPWLLMKLDDVIAYHDLEGDLSIAIYRKRESDSTPR